ncbi:MAG: SAM-dependent methyltransferase [Acidobacteriaceae bacterium]|jgi:23S rRNA (cytosine1962-C5)-methyltransferase|nr:SAM-dependent methyltransferase [Acidobacteriaceae bacterium]
MPPSSNLPAVKISRRGTTRLKEGHVWVYRSDIVSANGVNPGALVSVTDERGKPFGTALYSSSSQIAIRMISPHPVTDLPSLIRERIQQAIQYRDRVVNDTDAHRIVFSEADFLPGLIVDRYNDILSVQILTQAMDEKPIRQAVISELNELLKPASIMERVDSRVRDLEQLPALSSGLIQGEKTSTIITMNGVQFHYEGLEGQKTGAFLDQRENYAAAAQYARGEALDVFSYHGGFALHLAKTCSKVTGVDSSRPALEMGERNATLNRQEIEWIEANAFDLLRDYSNSGRLYDTIVLDPPAFAKSKRTLDTALRGYKELNLRALKMLRPGGILVTCSCSYHVSQPEFLGVVSEAARDAHKNPRIIESRTQAKDHPILLSVPETSYLKCVILQLSS